MFNSNEQPSAVSFNSAKAMLEEMPQAITIDGVDYRVDGTDPSSQTAIARLVFLESELQRQSALIEELSANRMSVINQLKESLHPA